MATPHHVEPNPPLGGRHPTTVPVSATVGYLIETSESAKLFPACPRRGAQCRRFLLSRGVVGAASGVDERVPLACYRPNVAEERRRPVGGGVDHPPRAGSGTYAASSGRAGGDGIPSDHPRLTQALDRRCVPAEFAEDRIGELSERRHRAHARREGIDDARRQQRHGWAGRSTARN